MNNNFVRLSATAQTSKRFWIAAVLLLFRLGIPDAPSANTFAFIQYTEWTSLLYALNKTFPCSCLRRSTDDEYDHVTYSRTTKRKRSLSAIRKWLGVEQIRSIQGSVRVVCTTYGTHPLTEDFHFFLPRFYINHSTGTEVGIQSAHTV